MGKVKRKVYAPMRKLTCYCENADVFEDAVKKICGSLKNTKEATKNPNVKFDPIKVTGKLKSKDAYLEDLAAVKPKIIQCWKNMVAKDVKFPDGFINMNVTFGPDGSHKSSSNTRSFYKAKDEPLLNCVEKEIYSVKPQPEAGEVKLQWNMEFKLY